VFPEYVQQITRLQKERVPVIVQTPEAAVSGS